MQETASSLTKPDIQPQLVSSPHRGTTVVAEWGNEMKRVAIAALCAVPLVIAGCGSSTSASSTPVPTIPAATPKADPCAGAVSWTEASSLEGETAFIKGPVKSALYESSSTGEPTFLNIGADYPSGSRFTVVIWGKNRDAFPTEPDIEYDGETVCVRGRVEDYRGITQMQVSSPSQIHIAG